MTDPKGKDIPLSQRLAWMAGAWAIGVLVLYIAKVGTAFRYLAAPFDLDLPPVDGPVFAEVMFGNLKVILTALLAVVVTFRWGARVLKLLGVTVEDPWVRAGVHLGFGVLFLDLLWLSTGLNGLWCKPLLIVLGSGMALESVLTFSWRGAWRTVKDSCVPPGAGERGPFLLGIVGLAYWGFTFLQAILPETFYDSMVYHLAVPSNWLLRHGIQDLPGQFFSNYPYGGELFFLNGLFFGGAGSARVLHALVFLALALTAGGWAREESGPGAGWMTFGLVLTLPIFVINASTTQVEVLLAFFLLLGAYFLLQEAPGAVLPAMLFLAQACAIKYTAALAIIALGVGLAVARRVGFLKGLPRMAAFGLMAGSITLLPWLIKNAVFTSDPLFPYGIPWGEGRALPAEGLHALLMEQQGRIAHGWECLTLPFTAVFSSPNAFNFTGPMVLALFPLGLVWASRHPWKGFGRIMLPLYFLLGFGITHILRFLSAGVVFLYALVGAQSGKDGRRVGRKAVSILGILSAFLCSGFLAAIGGRYEPGLGIWTGRQTRESYLADAHKLTPYFPMAQWLDANSPKDLRLLIVGDARGLYYPRPFLSNSVFDAQELAWLVRTEKDAAGIRKRLKEEGVDALVVNASEGIRVAPSYGHYNLTSVEWARLDGFIQSYTELAYFHNDQGVYRLLPAPKAVGGIAPETLDLVLFFSEPAAHFAQDVSRSQWPEAKDALERAVALYPFSGFWKEQKRKFDEALAPQKAGTR